MEQKLSIILQNTYSLSSLKIRMRVLKNYLAKSFFGGIDIKIDNKRDLAWLNSLPKTFFDNFNKSNMMESLTQLNHLTEQLQTITIYLAFEVTSEAEEQIGIKVRTTLEKPNLLLDIRYNPSLLAGAAFVWNGIYRDYSLKSRIEDRKVVILDSFKKFLR